MVRLTPIFLLFIFTGLHLYHFPQICFHKKNQFDAEKKKHGYWVTTSKSNPQCLTFKGWYNHGKETRRCAYYNDGIRWSKIHYLNDSVMHIKRFNQQGKIEYKGRALWLENDTELRFCWDGEFVFYGPHRHRIKKVIYIKGVEQDLE